MRRIGRRRGVVTAPSPVHLGGDEAGTLVRALHAPRPGDRDEGRIQVVERRRRDECLRQAGDAPDEVRAPLRVELTEHVVEQEQGRPTIQLGEEVELEDAETGAVRPARLDPAELAAYRTRLEDFLARVTTRCRSLGLRHLALNTGTPLAETIFHDLTGVGILS